jgi:hypothetical protein
MYHLAVVYVSSRSIIDVSIITEHMINPLEFSGPAWLPRLAPAPGAAALRRGRPCPWLITTPTPEIRRLRFDPEA